jgi:hypothetical protein
MLPFPVPQTLYKPLTAANFFNFSSKLEEGGTASQTLRKTGIQLQAQVLLQRDHLCIFAAAAACPGVHQVQATTLDAATQLHNSLLGDTGCFSTTHLSGSPKAGPATKLVPSSSKLLQQQLLLLLLLPLLLPYISDAAHSGPAAQHDIRQVTISTNAMQQHAVVTHKCSSVAQLHSLAPLLLLLLLAPLLGVRFSLLLLLLPLNHAMIATVANSNIGHSGPAA